MKIKTSIEGLALPATIETAGVPQAAMVKITGDETVDIAGNGEEVHGFVKVAAKDATEEDAACTIEFNRYRRVFTAKAVGGALAAGALVQAGAPATGNVSTVKAIGSAYSKYVVGVVWIGAAENGEVTVLGF